MTLADILANEELRRHEFPVASEKIFLAHAGVCPLPRRVAEAIRAYASQCTRGDQETLLPAYHLQHARELAARLLNARPDEIAFVGPTSLALSFVGGGLQFEPDDDILIYRDDYPSNVYPWMALAARGVEVRFLKVSQVGRIEPADVLAQVNPRTRLVALASCHFVAGYRIDLGAIGESLRERGILFCVDAIQTVGAFPTSVEGIDFLAADAHKWLLGPCAAGILFVRKALQEKLQPTAFGWNNVRCPNYVAQESMIFRPDARRYEAGTHNLLGLLGLNAALELLLEIGIDQIAAELLRKRAWLVPALAAKGYAVLEAKAPAQNASGIVSFFRPGVDLVALHQKLENADVITSLRADRSGQRYIRISPHFYNTDAELNRLLELL
ncbi:MAG: aminotransferase class V-fold PLP-dependent enzyme [Verrucomicrobia bacterium]|nr:aminotransferase class V-fold PLP-dependent enzyme [Verrucomicrobiota bacterium]